MDFSDLEIRIYVQVFNWIMERYCKNIITYLTRAPLLMHVVPILKPRRRLRKQTKHSTIIRQVSYSYEINYCFGPNLNDSDYYQKKKQNKVRQSAILLDTKHLSNILYV